MDINLIAWLVSCIAGTGNTNHFYLRGEYVQARGGQVNHTCLNQDDLVLASFLFIRALISFLMSTAGIFLSNGRRRVALEVS